MTYPNTPASKEWGSLSLGLCLEHSWIKGCPAHIYVPCMCVYIYWNFVCVSFCKSKWATSSIITVNFNWANLWKKKKGTPIYTQNINNSGLHLSYQKGMVIQYQLINVYWILLYSWLKVILDQYLFLDLESRCLINETPCNLTRNAQIFAENYIRVLFTLLSLGTVLLINRY